jgi:hypothetical protein
MPFAYSVSGGAAEEKEIAAIQTALSAANFLFSTVAIVAHAIENDAIRSIHGGIHHGRSEHLLPSNSPCRTMSRRTRYHRSPTTDAI